MTSQKAHQCILRGNYHYWKYKPFGLSFKSLIWMYCTSIVNARFSGKTTTTTKMPLTIFCIYSLWCWTANKLIHPHSSKKHKSKHHAYCNYSPGPVLIKHLKSNVYVTLNAIGSFLCNLCFHWLIQIFIT